MSSTSLLVEAVQAIIVPPGWPDSFNTNTPKQVLLLHEVEMLLEKATIQEFAQLQGPLLVS